MKNDNKIKKAVQKFLAYAADSVEHYNEHYLSEAEQLSEAELKAVIAYIKDLANV